MLLNKPAPNFTLKDSDGNSVTLSDLKGQPLILLFFPLAFTCVCTKELCYVRDSIQSYNELNTKVLAISVDSFFTLAQYKSQQNLNFQLLSDFNKEVSVAYNAYYDDFYGMHGVSKRAAFVLDSEHIIKYEEVLEKASDLPDFQIILETLSRIE
jgi:glutaredoxin-dependent peroxiredoxin